MTDHILDDLEAYALGALATADAQRLAEHLAACASCQGEAAALADVVGALPDTVPLREPTPSLRDRVVAAVRADSGLAKPATARWRAGRVRRGGGSCRGESADLSTYRARSARNRMLSARETHQLGAFAAAHEGRRIGLVPGCVQDVGDRFAGFFPQVESLNLRAHVLQNV